MKFTIASTLLFFIFSFHSFAQDSGAYLNPSSTSPTRPYFSLTAGINAIDNSNESSLPFDGGSLNVNTPFFIAAERKFQNRWSLALNLSTNQIDIGTAVAPYFGADISANIFVDDLIFKNEDIDLYLGLGTGMHTLRGFGEEVSFNVNGGMRYWVTENVGISFQVIGKIKDVETGITRLDSHYQFNIGASYRLF